LRADGGQAAPGAGADDLTPASGDDDGFRHAPDEAEDDAVARSPKPARPAKSRSRNRRHGRRR
ncbi:MAG: hypothetical protein WAL63_22380, partial [Solirubrobacteraceae bacterium]